MQFGAASRITRGMRLILINRARRPDRLAAMTQKAAALGLHLDRLNALDAAQMQLPGEYFDDQGPLGEIPRGDKCCTLSHRMAWEQFVASGEDYAAPQGLQVFAAKFKNVTSVVLGANGVAISDFLMQRVESWLK